MTFLFAILRVIGFILFFLALLRVKKTRLRHIPSCRTRVSRHHGETCVWTERLVNAVLQMFYAALQDEEEKKKSSSVGDGTKKHDNKYNEHNETSSPTFGGTGRRLRGERRDIHGGGTAAAGLKDAPRRLLDVVEERLEALLEDRGIAANATCSVHTIGHTPPTIRAIRVTNLTGTESTSNIPAAASNVGTSAAAASAPLPLANSISGNAGVPNSGGVASGAANNPASHKKKNRLPQTGSYVADDKAEKWRGDSCYEEVLNGNNASFPASVVELEAEVEYAGGADFSLQADISLVRGRLLPVSIRLNDIKYVKAHVCVRATLQHERATMDSRRKPYLQCTLWLESEPAFSLKMTTLFSQYRIDNFFAIPLITKFCLLRFVRNRMMRPNGAGVTVRIPLPENIVDGGVQAWCGSVNDVGTSVSSVHGRGPSRGFV